MNLTIKLNNVKPDDIIFSTGSENIIYTNYIEEEISGLVSLDINGQNIFCEKVQDNYVKAMLTVNGDSYSEVYFKVMKGKSSVVLSKNYTKFAPPGMVTEQNNYSEFLKNNKTTKISQTNEKTLEFLKREIVSLKKELHKSRQLVVEKTEPILKESTDYRHNLLNEHLIFIEQQRKIVKDSIKTIYNECVEEITNNLKQKNEYLSNLIKVRLESVEKNIFKKNKQQRVKNIDIITEQVEDFAKSVIEEKEKKINLFLQNKISELNEILNASAKSKINDSISIIEQTLLPFNLKLKNIEEQMNRLDNIAAAILDEKSSQLVEKVDDKLKVIEEYYNNFKKKLADLDKKSQELVMEKKQVSQRFQHHFSEARKYTDVKFQEAMGFSRKMLDYAGGGGTVSVQYAAGGTMVGNLNVEGAILSGGRDISTIFTNTSGNNTIYGDVNVTGSYLSGGNNLLDIFAGEGEGDSNTLDGGLV
jgi:ribosomal protein S20